MSEWLTDATVEIKGKDRNGTPITVTGDIEDVRVQREVDFDNDDDFYRNHYGKRIPETGIWKDQYFLKFKEQSDGTQYKIQLETRDVERTAEIEVDGCTPGNIERARKAVGAPLDAGVRPLGAGYWPEAVRINLASDKVKLVFVWTEKVVVR